MSAVPLVLDTGVIIGIAKGNKLGAAVRERHLATVREERPLVSVVSIAECRSIALQQLG